MNYSKGICWIDDCRIPFVDDETTINHNTQPGSFVGSFGSSEKIYKENTQGRFPANLLVSDDMLNDGSVNGIHKNYIHSGGSIEQKIYGGGKGIPLKANRNIVSDKGTNSRYYDIDKWFNNLLENYIY